MLECKLLLLLPLSAALLLSLPMRGQEPPTPKEPPARDTTTGKDFEKIVKKALEKEGYQVTEQIQVGTRPNGGKHIIDLVAKKENRSSLISLKWQQSSGTAEQKVPYELICLSEALEQSRGTHQTAYLVLGGEGWTLKKFYLAGGLNRHLKLAHKVAVLDFATLLQRAREATL